MYCTIDGSRLFFKLLGGELSEDGKLTGHKPVLLAIPGGPGFSHTIFAEGLTPLAQYFTVLFVDPFGTGKSEERAVANWGLGYQAKVVVELCRQLSIESVILYTYSSSCHLVPEVLMCAPDLLSGAVLCSPVLVSIASFVEHFAQIDNKEVADIVRAVWLQKDESKVSAYIEQVMPLYNPIPIPPDQVQSLELNINMFFAVFDDFLNVDLLSRLHNVHCPLLLLIGKHDPFSPVFSVQSRLQNLPLTTAKTVWLEGSGHDPFLTEPDTVRQCVRRFVEQVVEL